MATDVAQGVGTAILLTNGTEGKGYNMEKPKARGPSPSRKAHRALGDRLNRKPKEPPTLPGGKIKKKPPLTHRLNH